MNAFITAGIVLGGGTIVTDRFIHKLPQWLAIILFTAAVVLIIAVYIVGLVFAIMGKGYAIPVVMTSMLVAAYIAVYFHLGQVLVRLLKGKNKKNEDGDDLNG